MEVILHLGIHKTASTFLQKEVFPHIKNSLFLNREKSKPFKDYILYTDDFLFSADTAIGLFKQLIEDHAESDSSSQVIISDEEYYGNPFWGSIDRKRNIDRLLQTFDKNIKVLLVLRNQVGLFSSLYNQYVKTGGTATLHQFYTYKKYPLIVSEDYFMFDRYIKYISSRVSPAALNVCLYEDFLANREVFIRAIFRFLGREDVWIELRLEKTTNSSIPANFLPLMRFFNMLTRSPKEPFLLVSIRAHKIARKLLTAVRFGRTLGKKTHLDGNQSFFREIGASNEELDKFMPSLDLELKGYPVLKVDKLRHD